MENYINMDNTANKCGVLIPAYQPDELLIKLIEKLNTYNLPVYVVNDGSVGCEAVFAQVQQLGANLISYDTNRGKGYALKTGLSAMHDAGFTSAVTADADGQHTPEDIIKVMDCLAQNPDSLVLGVRKVDEMPLRSKFGNSLTCVLFKWLYGMHITDTQTGLRGIPLEKIDSLTALEGDRYEYEMNMLVMSNSLFSSIQEVPIETIYIDDNGSSHFNPIKDGLKIYRVLFKNLKNFILSSFSSFVLDYSLFNALYYLVFHNAVKSTVLARVVSSTYNFLINKYVVFKTDSKKYNIVKYAGLALCILAVNAGLMYLLVDIFHLPAALIKIVVERCRWCFSYLVQNRWASQ